jgi:hypothetical protein
MLKSNIKQLQELGISTLKRIDKVKFTLQKFSSFHPLGPTFPK